jgi:hypothetical protein
VLCFCTLHQNVFERQPQTIKFSTHARHGITTDDVTVCEVCACFRAFGPGCWTGGLQFQPVCGSGLHGHGTGTLADARSRSRCGWGPVEPSVAGIGAGGSDSIRKFPTLDNRNSNHRSVLCLIAIIIAPKGPLDRRTWLSGSQMLPFRGLRKWFGRCSACDPTPEIPHFRHGGLLRNFLYVKCHRHDPQLCPCPRQLTHGLSLNFR